MSYVVISYPKISATDLALIQAVREKYDQRQYNAIGPHVTFVFPTTKLDESKLIRHVEQAVGKRKSFPVVFSSLKVVEDDSKKYFHTFLVPSVGFDEVTKLHDILYRGELESELRRDIPFMPHLGIANNSDRTVMDGLVKKLGYELPSIKGEINSLVLAKVDGSKITEVMRFELGR